MHAGCQMNPNQILTARYKIYHTCLFLTLDSPSHPSGGRARDLFLSLSWRPLGVWIFIVCLTFFLSFSVSYIDINVSNWPIFTLFIMKMISEKANENMSTLGSANFTFKNCINLLCEWTIKCQLCTLINWMKNYLIQWTGVWKQEDFFCNLLRVSAVVGPPRSLTTTMTIFNGSQKKLFSSRMSH